MIRSSGSFCGPTLSSYSSQNGISGYSSNQLCTSCFLGTLKSVLQNPLTYSSALFSTFQSAIASCGSAFSSYNMTASSPTSMFSKGTTYVDISSNVTASVACSDNGRTITLSSASTCAAIATQYSVSQADIQFNNPTISSLNCTVGIKSGTSLCLPQKCTLYTIPSNSNCSSIVQTVNKQSLAGSGQNITVAQLQSYNPELGPGCSNIASRVGTAICISPHGGFPALATAPSSVSRSYPIYSGTVAPPGPTASGSTSACAAWYAVKTGDQCNRVLMNSQQLIATRTDGLTNDPLLDAIVLNDFLAINTGVNYNCSNLVTGNNYCVAPYPPLSSGGVPVPTLSANYSSATIYSSALPTPTSSDYSSISYPSAYIPVPTNVAPGTISPCDFYYITVSGDSCSSVEAAYNISSVQFQQWNPTVAAGCDALPVNEGVCVLVASTTSTTTIPVSSSSVSTSFSSSIPSSSSIPPSSTVHSSSVPASSTSGASGPAQSKFGQCGGTGWTVSRFSSKF
ncbi:hypothetical protein SISSUDRAFT_67888 [Sistotremastrum suecicum HHB10207 ss-3]|uniref:LysM domain-containing protein n=1 Tax=Sistotremastrum suecicum HHB10207 ss-3 TaxID=1314776 RepID=A0A166BHU3_9AGAM|nr:hypothetical protein SISSUDRAFT_67888 [Sistotremastrum suecicum HHB10207 ss-3]